MQERFEIDSIHSSSPVDGRAIDRRRCGRLCPRGRPWALCAGLLITVISSGCGGHHAEVNDPLASIPIDVKLEDMLPTPIIETWRNPAAEQDGSSRLPSVRPAVGATHVFLGYEDQLEALRARDGSLAWRFEAGSPLTVAPVPAGETVVVGTRDAILWVSAGKGEVTARLPVAAPPVAMMSTATGQLLYADTTHLQSGDFSGQRWQLQLPQVTAIAATADGTVAYASTAIGALVAVDVGTGAELWRYVTEEDARMTKAAVGRRLVYVAGTDNKLVALAADNGRLKWTRDLAIDVVSSPVLVEPLVWVAGFDAILHGINSGNGTETFTLG
ncbi:MAG: PQQ-binding-like beta-propeller repeat protein, partial [Acidobacteriota bacterium]